MIAVYLDFFLQVFVHALAWALAAAIGVTVAAVALRFFVFRSPRPRAWRRGL